MENTATNLTHEWILTENELNAVEAVEANEQTGNSSEVRALNYEFERTQNDIFTAPLKNKLFKMRVQQIQILEIEVEGLNADEAQSKALKIIENTPEMADLIRNDLGNSTIEEL